MRNYIPVQKLRRLISIIAYGTTAIDAVIAIVTLFSLSYLHADPEKMLIPLNILLTVVVLLAAVSAGLIVSVKIYESLLIRTFRFRTHMSIKLGSLNKYNYSRKRFFENLKNIFSFVE